MQAHTQKHQLPQPKPLLGSPNTHSPLKNWLQQLGFLEPFLHRGGSTPGEDGGDVDTRTRWWWFDKGNGSRISECYYPHDSTRRRQQRHQTGRSGGTQGGAHGGYC
ncbi:hypothetical protein V6N13_016853 [Hibiscus sabdariffa]